MDSKYIEGDKVANHWFIFAVLWFPLFTTFGLILAIKMFYPTFLVDAAWLTFGRIRPAHVNGVLFGFVSSGLIGTMFYVLPRLCANPLKRPDIAKYLPFAWNISIIAGIVMILQGNTQAREYAELPWVIDVLVMATLLTMGYIVMSTIMERKEHNLYVSLWFFAGIMVWFPIVYFVGNVMWNPPTGALNGVVDAIFNWYYGHNVLGLWFTPFGIGIWYYFIPRITKHALYSNTLSLISFFSIAFFYTGVGGHHLLQAPIPEWLKTIAVTTTGLMMFSVITFAVNIGMTLRQAWHNVIYNVPLRFMVFGFLNYIFTSMQGTLQGLRTTNAYLHFSQWPVGHAHLALLGAFGFTVVGCIYWLVPRVTGRKLYSNSMMNWSWWVAFTGFFFFMFAMTVAGLVANAQWIQHITVASALPTLKIYFILRAIGGGAIVVGAYIFAVDIIMTLLGRGPSEKIESKTISLEAEVVR
jgi:cytochrome c oxidase cbb3-type subunit I/II